jgi:hypothetical protein
MRGVDRFWRALAGAALWIGALGALVPGCASHCRYVDLESKPSGAAIYVDGEKLGVTRARKLRLDFSDRPERRVLIQVVMPRYRPVFEYWSIDEVPEAKEFVLQAD